MHEYTRRQLSAASLFHLGYGVIPSANQTRNRTGSLSLSTAVVSFLSRDILDMLLVDGLVQNHPNVTGQCLYKGETRCSLADMHLYEYRCERYHFFFVSRLRRGQPLSAFFTCLVFLWSKFAGSDLFCVKLRLNLRNRRLVGASLMSD